VWSKSTGLKCLCNRGLSPFICAVEEFAALRSQTVISNIGRGGRRTAPYAFTEQGVAMLSSVLGSPRAVTVNIEIMRTFVRVRELAITHHDLAKQLNALEEKTEAMAMQHDSFARNTRAQLKQVFDAIRELMTPPAPQKKRPIGFISGEEKPKKSGQQFHQPAEGFTLRLARYFGTDAQSWLNLQLNYDLKIAEAELKVRIKREVEETAA